MMKKLLLLFPLFVTACTSSITTSEVLLTAASGEKCAVQPAVTFTTNTLSYAAFVDVNHEKQTIDGIGGSMTESTAFVLACLPKETRYAVLRELFSDSGANFSAARTMIGASDFTLEGFYSLDDVEGDTALENFSLNEDKKGFSKEKYPQIVDEQFDLYHLITEVADIKRQQTDNILHLIGSPWTAPAWMKDNGKFYDKENRRGGSLRIEYYQTFADYFVRYLAAYRNEGIEFWAVTPENEPMGNDGSWESMDFPPAQEAEFIGKYLGPTLAENGFQNVKILGFDQNTFEMNPYVDAIYGDSAARRYTAGMALHWYGSTVSCFPEHLDSIHNLYPDKILFHTEGCVDNLGRDPWAGVTDPVGFKESGWFLNDDFWWNDNATDWAYSTPFWPEWHPKYAPVHRYAKYIIEGMNHWMTGFVDWNIVLDSIGGPTHVFNHCAAEVMVDYQSGTVYYTPYFYVLKQMSRTIRPGDVVLSSKCEMEGVYLLATRNAQKIITITVLNSNKQSMTLPMCVGDYSAQVQLPANSLLTLRIKV